MPQPEIVKPSRASIMQEARDFSLVLGGPLYDFYVRAGLTQPPLEFTFRRILGVSLICWLPPLLLSATAGRLVGGVPAPFLLDPEVHMRFLVALPLMIASEHLVHERMQDMVPQFLERGIIAEPDQPRFERIIASTMRLRNSAVLEFIMVILVLTLGYWIWRQKITLSVSSWYALRDGVGLHLTAAGSYYAFISMAIFRFVLIRWYFRMFLWYRFLWQVRALPLHLNLYHPDRTGGLGFLSGSLIAFAPVFGSQTAVLSSIILARILYAGEKLTAFKMEVGGTLLFLVLLIVLPTSFFSFQLEHAGRIARLEFGLLASSYVTKFREKWVLGGDRTGEPLLGTPDLQSLADLANSYAVVRELNLMPITQRNFFRLIAILALPLLPLVLTIVPLNELVARLFKLAF